MGCIDSSRSCYLVRRDAVLTAHTNPVLCVLDDLDAGGVVCGGDDRAVGEPESGDGWVRDVLRARRTSLFRRSSWNRNGIVDACIPFGSGVAGLVLEPMDAIRAGQSFLTAAFGLDRIGSCVDVVAASDHAVLGVRNVLAEK